MSRLPAYIKAAIRSGPIPKVRDLSKVKNTDLTRGERMVKFIEAYCLVPEGKLVGQPIKLELFQRLFILAIYDNPRKTRRAILSIARKNGKALALDTPIPGPDGWRPMGSLRPGDQVFDETGAACNVIATTPVMDDRPCYRVTFADGATITCDAEHEWTVRSRSRHNRILTLTTAQMAENVLLPYRRANHNERNYSVPVAGPVAYPDRADLALPPYTLGAWLGDGTSATAAITSADPEIVAAIKAEGIPVMAGYRNPNTPDAAAASYRLSDGVRNRAKATCPLHDLRAIGVLNNKHIPLRYLQAGYSQRMALLQGLMDTDGYISKAGQCEFVSVNETLFTDTLELIRSLGFKASTKIDRAKLKGRDVGPRYRIQFWAFSDRPVFKLARKAARLRPHPGPNARSQWNYITSIEPAPSVPVRCIQVDSPSSLYLAGKAFTPTHNSALIACILLGHLIGPEAQRNAQLVSGALTKKQAGLVFQLAEKMINLNPKLQALATTQSSYKTISGLAKGTEYAALASEGPAAQGLSPVLAILDETGQVKGASGTDKQHNFVNAITSAQGAHDEPLLVVISTQAPSDQDLLSVWIDDAERSDDPHTVCHVYETPVDEFDLLDEKGWKYSNPALGVFRNEADLQEQLKRAHRLPALEASASNLLLNRRVSADGLWLAPSVWKDNARAPNMELFRDGRPVAMGVDLAGRQDLTAAVLAATDDDGVVHLLPYTFCPADGVRERAQRDRAPYELWVKQGNLIGLGKKTMDYDMIAEWLQAELYDQSIEPSSVEYDAWRIADFSRACDKIGFMPYAQWNSVGQTFKDFSPRCEAFLSLLLESKIRHGNHPLLNMAAANAVVEGSHAEAMRLTKKKSTQRIDPLIAAVMAAYAVSEGTTVDDDMLAALIG